MSSGATHSPQLSVIESPLATPAQSAHDELLPAQIPQSSTRSASLPSL